MVRERLARIHRQSMNFQTTDEGLGLDFCTILHQVETSVLVPRRSVKKEKGGAFLVKFVVELKVPG